MKNKLVDLNNHLFAQLERLSDESIKGEELQEEIDRSRSVVNVSKQIIGNASLILEAEKFRVEHKGYTKNEVPELLVSQK